MRLRKLFEEKKNSYLKYRFSNSAAMHLHAKKQPTVRKREATVLAATVCLVCAKIHLLVMRYPFVLHCLLDGYPLSRIRLQQLFDEVFS